MHNNRGYKHREKSNLLQYIFRAASTNRSKSGDTQTGFPRYSLRAARLLRGKFHRHSADWFFYRYLRPGRCHGHSLKFLTFPWLCHKINLSYEEVFTRRCVFLM